MWNNHIYHRIGLNYSMDYHVMLLLTFYIVVFIETMFKWELKSNMLHHHHHCRMHTWSHQI